MKCKFHFPLCRLKTHCATRGLNAWNVPLLSFLLCWLFDFYLLLVTDFIFMEVLRRNVALGYFVFLLFNKTCKRWCCFLEIWGWDKWFSKDTFLACWKMRKSWANSRERVWKKSRQNTRLLLTVLCFKILHMHSWSRFSTKTKMPSRDEDLGRG